MATVKLQIGLPSCVWRVSGSRPRLPTRITLLTPQGSRVAGQLYYAITPTHLEDRCQTVTAAALRLGRGSSGACCSRHRKTTKRKAERRQPLRNCYSTAPTHDPAKNTGIGVAAPRKVFQIPRPLRGTTSFPTLRTSHTPLCRPRTARTFATTPSRSLARCIARQRRVCTQHTGSAGHQRTMPRAADGRIHHPCNLRQGFLNWQSRLDKDRICSIKHRNFADPASRCLGEKPRILTPANHPSDVSRLSRVCRCDRLPGCPAGS